MGFEEFGSVLAEICSHSPLAAERPLVWTIIANPKAGGFTIHSRWRKHNRMLKESSLRAKKNPLREASRPSQTALKEGGVVQGLIATRAVGHAAELTAALVKEAADVSADISGAQTNARPFYLIITAGGDGTSLEVMTALYHAPAEVRQDFVILRLPMGTGNDGADARELDKALNFLIDPVILSKQRALRLITASGKGPFLAFNILSVGMDAFVTHMTNKMKGTLPGDSYKLWVDIAALFYDWIYKIDYMDVRAWDENGKEIKTFREKLLLLAVGESGRRCYGSSKWILPDQRNVCAVKQTSLYRLFMLKALLPQGTHIDKPESIAFNAHAVEFNALHPLLAQMDGETVLLDNNDFPARIELTEPLLPVLKPVLKPVSMSS